MKTKHILFCILLASVSLLTGCQKKTAQTTPTSSPANYAVTFIELGSVNCVPCKMMVPVMKQVEENFKGRVQVRFYDVWTPQGRPAGEAYGIRAIPTQVFLDSEGKEFYRHEGFFPYEQVVQVLAQKGVK